MWKSCWTHSNFCYVWSVFGESSLILYAFNVIQDRPLGFQGHKIWPRKRSHYCKPHAALKFFICVQKTSSLYISSLMNGHVAYYCMHGEALAFSVFNLSCLLCGKVANVPNLVPIRKGIPVCKNLVMTQQQMEWDWLTHLPAI